jgi:cytidylate kinase
MIIAIDGPAASGKSTVARATAERLVVGYLDTGAMYRAVALKAVETGASLEDESALAHLAESAVITFEREDGALATRVILDGEDVTQDIRSPAVNHAVSPVARVPGVRRAMVVAQRGLVGASDTVVEGRDIGSVVFPDADVKVYLIASAEERARRRLGDRALLGVDTEQRAVEESLGRRDEIDSTRADSPLTMTDDAVEIDTTGLTIEQVVDRIVGLARRS